MRCPSPRGRAVVVAALLCGTVGCGTTRSTDTARAASEMLLVSQAVDHAVAQIDFSPLAAQPVYLDVTALDKDSSDRGYLVSVIRQQLLAAGALLQEERFRAIYVVEVRSGAMGTDRHSLLVGTPAVTLPGIVPGLPLTSIPEIALMKKSDQRGVAKLGVFAYNRITGRALWQSGTVEAISRAHDTWVFGAGPFSHGTIRKRTELAGEPLPTFPLTIFGTPDKPLAPAATSQEQFFPVGGPAPLSPLPPVIPASILGITGNAALIDRPLVH
ncbi:MAG TPA: DUF6655 family protein [Gemmataceae bacterium]